MNFEYWIAYFDSLLYPKTMFKPEVWSMEFDESKSNSSNSSLVLSIFSLWKALLYWWFCIEFMPTKVGLCHVTNLYIGEIWHFHSDPLTESMLKSWKFHHFSSNVSKIMTFRKLKGNPGKGGLLGWVWQCRVIFEVKYFYFY